MLILGIESSCDETAAAVVRDGREMLSSVVASQVELHRPFGGVVPELASREHLDRIDPAVREALSRAEVTFSDIDGIAVTQGPGLIGSLLVGLCFAKSLAFGLKIPLIGVNHIEGHFYSVVFDNPPLEYPVLALIVSGGHTNLFFSTTAGQYELVSRTRDDAAGEAFDKVGKMLGLGYPGGPAIERAAAAGDPRAIRFPVAKISDGKPDFSFSGLKTAVSRYIRETSAGDDRTGTLDLKKVADIAAGFQATVVRSLVLRMESAARSLRPVTLIVAGGVACNESLRTEASRAAARLGIPVYFPSRHLSTDNAAMIAAAGSARLAAGYRSGPEMTADITLRLQNHGLVTEAKSGRKRYKL